MIQDARGGWILHFTYSVQRSAACFLYCTSCSVEGKTSDEASALASAELIRHRVLYKLSNLDILDHAYDEKVFRRIHVQHLLLYCYSCSKISLHRLLMLRWFFLLQIEWWRAGSRFAIAMYAQHNEPKLLLFVHGALFSLQYQWLMQFCTWITGSDVLNTVIESWNISQF